MNRSRALLWASAVGLACATATSLLGCGSGDDNSTQVPGPSDAGPWEAAADSSMKADSGTAMDSTLPSSDTGVDATLDAIAVHDVQVEDVANDVRADDVIIDAHVANDGEASTPQQPLDASTFDASTSMAEFPGQVAAAICERTAACCGTTANAPDFNLSFCLSVSQGFNGSNLGAQYIDGGNVAFDTNKAQECLANLRAVDCATNNISSALATVLYQSCFGALTGTLPTGSSCHDAIECTSGDYCSPGDGGALGTCQPLKQEGQPCGDFASVTSTPQAKALGQTECSYRASGNTAFWCDYFDLTTGAAFADAAAWTCTSDLQLNSLCANGQECESFVCDPGANRNVNRCASSSSFDYPFACAAYIVDAGADH